MAFEPRATSFSTANAQLLAQASTVAYDSPERCVKWAKVSGFTGAFDFFDNHDTQGFVAESGDAIIVAFRGTQPNRPMDWFVDFRATSDPWDHQAGKVHSGFYSALRKVWGVTLPNGEVLPKRLVNRGSKTIWITGHSLGGALAELCAAQALFCSKIPVQGVYTFGQPRVGTKEFADAVNAKIATSSRGCRSSRWASVIMEASASSITRVSRATRIPPSRRSRMRSRSPRVHSTSRSLDKSEAC
jgi:triacylglycerol lipase